MTSRDRVFRKSAVCSPITHAAADDDDAIITRYFCLNCLFLVQVAKTAQYTHHVPQNNYDYDYSGHYDANQYEGQYDAGHYESGHYY